MQEDFSKGCPIVSQLRSVVEAISSNEEATRETQETFGKGLCDMVGGTPGVGHVLVVVELALGNKEKAKEYLELANRMTAVIGDGIVGGPVGAVATRMAIDALQIGIASLAHQDYHPTGLIAGVTKLIRTSDVGVMFDTTIMRTLDAFLGKATNAPHLKSAIIAEKEGTWASFKASTIEMRKRLEAMNIPETQADEEIYKSVKIGRELHEAAQNLGLDKIASGCGGMWCSATWKLRMKGRLLVSTFS